MNKLFDTESNEFIISSHSLNIAESQIPSRLIEEIYRFHHRMSSQKVDDTVVAILCAITLFSPDRLGVEDTDTVEALQHELTCLLQSYITGTRRKNISSFAVRDNSFFFSYSFISDAPESARNNSTNFQSYAPLKNPKNELYNPLLILVAKNSFLIKNNIFLIFIFYDFPSNCT